MSRHDLIAQNKVHKDDIHNKLMKAYKSVPKLWYIGTFVFSFIAALIAIHIYDLELPWTGFLLALFISFIFILPIGIITAVSNQTPGLNVLTEFVAGFMYPGLPMANVSFKVFGYITMQQTLTFLSDLKLGHYMKIAPNVAVFLGNQ